MIQLFTIFGKGGIALWCFSEGTNFLNATVNDFVRNVILQEKSITSYSHEGYTIKYKLDNEFDLILMIVYQSVVQLAYADKLLTDVHLRFRDMYKNALSNFDCILLGGPKVFKSFDKEFLTILDNVKSAVIICGDSKKPRTFQESDKSKKTVSSMIESGKEKKQVVGKKKEGGKIKETIESKGDSGTLTIPDSPKDIQQRSADEEDEEILRNRNALFGKRKGKTSRNKDKENIEQTSAAMKKGGKQARKWDLKGTEKDAQVLDYSAVPSTGETKNEDDGTNGGRMESSGGKIFDQNKTFIGKLKGELPGLDAGQMVIMEEDDAEEEEEATLHIGLVFGIF